MPKQTFILNGKTTTVNVADDVRVLWVLRDVLGVTGPKYGCGINVCKACTSHINGKAFNPCAVPVGNLGDVGAWIARITPLWHGVNLSRMFTLDHVTWWVAGVNVAVLAVLLVAGWRWAVTGLEGRLVS